MKAAPARTRATATSRRLLVHTRREVIEVRLTGDVQLDALLRRLAARGGFVIEQAITDEERAPCR